MHKKFAPKILSFLHEKGGVGKTTNSINVSRGLELRGYKTLLVDSDAQKNSQRWAEISGSQYVTVVGAKEDDDEKRITTQESLKRIIKSFKADCHFMVIDCPPGVSTLTAFIISVSDYILIPICPSVHDFNATAVLLDLIQSRQKINPSLKAALFMSKLVKNSKSYKEACEGLKNCELPVFDSFTTQTQAYVWSQGEGKTIYESKHKEAIKQTDDIINELFRRFIDGSSNK